MCEVVSRGDEMGHREGRGPILVVDDDQALRSTLARILRAEGHPVIEAEDGPTAVRLSRTKRPSLLVLDYGMPGMDGEMVLSEVRALMGHDAPPALLLTATVHQQERARKIGAALGLCKPFQVEELLRAVARHRRAGARPAEAAP